MSVEKRSGFGKEMKWKERERQEGEGDACSEVSPR